ncbi:MAG: alkaline phosphatase [Clostridia bacterium]|nr:alkaline phosphatase [Clostridia bacterium]
MKTKRILSLLLTLIMAFALCVPALAVDADPEIRNVIIMIGDGMGENHLKLAEQYGHTLFMNTEYDLRGQSMTSSISHITTDSAAGGTALACGMRVINQTVGVLGYDPFGLVRLPMSITEVAAEKGMRTGVVTTDKTTGATPADFTVHVLYRKQYEKIGQAQIETNFDLIWGTKESTLAREDVEAHGWTYVSNRDEMLALEPGSRSYGQFSGQLWRPNNSLTLAEMSTKAIELLNTDNDKGFFLMIEGAHIDKNSHTSDGLKMDYDEKRESVVDAVVGFDNAIRDVVEFAREDGHTVVLVTADHETGWIFADIHGDMRFHSDEHTAHNVPVFVYGNKTLFKANHAVANYTIPIRLARLLGWGKDEFPRARDGSLIKRLPEDASPGDVDGDGDVTAADARLALRAAVGLEEFEPGSAEFLSADMDGDGVITAADARQILRIAVDAEA